MWRQRLIVILALAAVVEIVALGIRGLLKDALITPLLYLIWGVMRIFESIPQGMIWLVFVAAASIVALASIWGGRRGEVRRDTDTALRGRVYEWLRLVALAQRHDYSRWRMAQRLMLLLAETIAARERIELRIARQRIVSGAIDAPQDVVAFLRAGADSYRTRQRALFQREEPSPLDVDLEQVVFAVERLVRDQ
ncbi:hypothetical protein [Roseiflexus castenholzii]|jgi:hypothetical protein|uniref:Uncharacterized protein n=1 Tax=Roseiflexus castenholzii (strain DSM 13941 / HLO8) TaxID=383372 RepID=A7NN43_ROSCS|nr:hypothetical protein [Roseiflexus castenholzii]ABU58975.1 conserved hypothetical protein [Roseiflexus castenholzii DSM 13941]